MPSHAPELPNAITPAASIPAAAPKDRLPRAYPWLLVLSTGIAALFCLMYITKPIILSSAAPVAPAALPQKPARPNKPSAPATAIQTGLMPGGDRLPGDPVPSAATTKPATAPSPAKRPTPPGLSSFEETNLKIQHILTAEAPGGYLARMDLDVPVLYQSRVLRWTTQDVAEARDLVVRLTDYQEKSRRLRDEAADLLTSWNRLVERSLPSKDLRADSPSLPSNQQNHTERSGAPIATDSIRIQPAGK